MVKTKEHSEKSIDFILNGPPLTSTNCLKAFLSQKLAADNFLSYYLILSHSTHKEDKNACIVSN